MEKEQKMKLSKLFENKWGWAARGEEPPPVEPKAKPELTPQQRRERLKEKERQRRRRSWMPKVDVADELLKKQAANAARARKPFFPED